MTNPAAQAGFQVPGCGHKTYRKNRQADRRGNRILGAFPRRTRQYPAHGVPASLAKALAAGPLGFGMCAERTDRSWRTFAMLTARTPLPVRPEQSLDFDIYTHSARQFTPGSAFAVTRRAAYRGSRAGRKGSFQDDWVPVE